MKDVTAPVASGSATRWPIGIVVAAGLAYFALAQAAFATIGRRAVLGVSQTVAEVTLLVAAVVVFPCVAITLALRTGTQWLAPTITASAAAAMLGALAHTVTLGVQVRWGKRCNQCPPVAFMIELTLLAGAVAAAGALAVGFVARRVGGKRAGSPAG